MTFDTQGQCVRVPGQSHIPKGAKVASYPVCEGMGMVWIWMGDPDTARSTERFHLHAWDNPERTVSVGKHRVVNCHYQLLTDNLTDPAHVAFVHRSTLGSAAQEDIPVKVIEDGNAVVVERWTLDSPPAPIFTNLAGMQDNVDRWQYYYLHCPSICVVDFGSAAPGTLDADSSRETAPAVQMYSCIFMTPQTERTTHYFYWQSRNFAIGDEAVSAKVLEQIDTAFAEDFAILEAQQHSLDTFPVTDDVRLALDSAPTRQRRIVQRMLDAETPASTHTRQ
jgi:vanillate O-demethylase monooxygenase subunit